MNTLDFIEYVKKEIGLELNEKQVDQFKTYAEFLKEYNEKINLTAITEYEEVLEKHFLDSLFPLRMLELKENQILADIGTGAGFPGVVLKIAKPELKVELIEPLGKRCIFLNLLIEKLGLTDIKVINSRVEDLKCFEKYDYVTARAVTALNVLTEITVPFLKIGGHFIVLRGKDGLNEIKEAENAFKVLKVKQVKLDCFEYLGNTRVNALYLKTDKNQKKYPRNYGEIKKKPL